MESLTRENKIQKYTGGCHCGAVRFEAELDLSSAGRCNCTICTKSGATGCSIKPEKFTLLSGKESLSSYEWGAKISTRFFCKNCGILCFSRGHLPELGGDFVSINLNCIDNIDINTLPITYWDGRHDNWEAGPRSTPWPIFPPQ